MVSEVRVVDPRHALCGERLTLLSLVCARGPKYIAVCLADGRRRLLPRTATDLDQPVLAEPDVPRISAHTTGPRPWPALLPQDQTRLAQHLACLLRRMHSVEKEARRADLAQ